VTGEFYRQFAVTIAVATVISGFNSLTLSPALAATLLRPHDAPKDRLTHILDALFGWIFRPFNRFFAASAGRYQGSVTRSLRRRGLVFVVYAGLLVATGLMFQAVPGGFIPTQDKLYLIGAMKLPEGASLDRTEAVVRRMSQMAMETEGVASAVAFPGLNPMHFNNTPNAGTVFFTLDDFSGRTRDAEDIANELNMKFSSIQEAFAFAFQPPAVLGIGTGSGYALFVQDRAGLGHGELQHAVQNLSGALAQVPGMGFPFSSYQSNVPQLDAHVDRAKAKAQGVSLTDLFETLQVYLGSAYVNDFNRFGRTWQVIAQADAGFRDDAEGIGRLRTRNEQGEMVPIGSMVRIEQTYGPDPVLRYNGYPAADLMGEADPRRLSSAQALAVVEAIAPTVLPPGIRFEWTDLSYQQVNQGDAAVIAVALAVLLAFLALAALYESWTLPLAVILIVPMCVLSALLGVWAMGGDNNLFVQVGLVLLMGLACKNAILIVEFARDLERHGLGIVEAALEACRLRLRPIIMTSITFTAAVVPLVLATGAGAEIRNVLGIAVFAGMIGVTAFGLFLTPVFYVALRKLAVRLQSPNAVAETGQA
jgi:multidrug efflux pump